MEPRKEGPRAPKREEVEPAFMPQISLFPKDSMSESFWPALGLVFLRESDKLAPPGTPHTSTQIGLP